MSEFLTWGDSNRHSLFSGRGQVMAQAFEHLDTYQRMLESRAQRLRADDLRTIELASRPDLNTMRARVRALESIAAAHRPKPKGVPLSVWQEWYSSRK